MNILIDIGHPAHVHLFKNFVLEMKKKGHELFFTCRDKEYAIYLLEYYGFNYKSFGSKYKSRFGKILGLVKFGIKEYITGLKFKPDILLSHGSIYASHAAFILGKPHISLEDTFNFEQVKLYKPFTKAILTGNYGNPLTSQKVIRYAGYHELAYLHPNYFIPDMTVLKELQVLNNEPYVLIRFVSWEATHDVGHKGISLGNKIDVVKRLSKQIRVFISSESLLPEVLQPYSIKLAPHRIHDAIAFSSLIFGESATMVSEGAVLGVPGVYIDKTGRLYTKELENRYGLVYNFNESFSDQLKAIQKAEEIISDKYSNKWQQKRNKLINEKIDVTSFLVWFIENWPQSYRIMKENPDYQYRFK